MPPAGVDPVRYQRARIAAARTVARRAGRSPRARRAAADAATAKRRLTRARPPGRRPRRRLDGEVDLRGASARNAAPRATLTHPGRRRAQREPHRPRHPADDPRRRRRFGAGLQRPGRRSPTTTSSSASTSPRTPTTPTATPRPWRPPPSRPRPWACSIGTVLADAGYFTEATSPPTARTAHRTGQEPRPPRRSPQHVAMFLQSTKNIAMDRQLDWTGGLSPPCPGFHGAGIYFRTRISRLQSAASRTT